jgi:hypothetical protein
MDPRLALRDQSGHSSLRAYDVVDSRDGQPPIFVTRLAAPERGPVLQCAGATIASA